MSQNQIPRPMVAVVDASGFMNPAWYRFFSSPTFSGPIGDNFGKIRAIPKSGATATANRVLTAADIGLCVEIGTGGSVEIPNAVFVSGDIVWIYNDTVADKTITCTITTAYIAGVDADKATMTLATRGLAMIRFKSGTECVVNGNVS